MISFQEKLHSYRAIYLVPFKRVRAVWRFYLQYYRRFREPVTKIYNTKGKHNFYSKESLFRNRCTKAVISSGTYPT